jgi:hypothetical protein
MHDICSGPKLRFCLITLRWGTSLVKLNSEMTMQSTGKSLNDTLLFCIPYSVKRRIGL